MKEKIIFTGAIGALACIITSYIRTKKPRHLYIAILFIGTMLWWYPFQLPPEAGFTVWGALSAWIVFCDPSRKNPESHLNMVVLMLITFTIVFLTKTLIDMKLL